MAAADVVTRTVGGYQLVEYPSAPMDRYPWRWVASKGGRPVATGVFCSGDPTDPAKLADVLRLALAMNRDLGATCLELRERRPEEQPGEDPQRGRVGAEVELGDGCTTGPRVRLVVP